MATLKCLACGYGNKAGDEACAACSSSLNLKLCGACEAVNAARAEKCHGCGAPLAEEVPVEVPVLETLAAEEKSFATEPPPRKSLPMRLRVIDMNATARTSRFAGVWVVSVAVAAAGGTTSRAGRRSRVLRRGPPPSLRSLRRGSKSNPRSSNPRSSSSQRLQSRRRGPWQRPRNRRRARLRRRLRFRSKHPRR